MGEHPSSSFFLLSRVFFLVTFFLLTKIVTGTIFSLIHNTLESISTHYILHIRVSLYTLLPIPTNNFEINFKGTPSFKVFHI